MQAAKAAIIALGSDIPKPEFIDLLAGFEHFARHGEALPDETVRSVICLARVSKIEPTLNVESYNRNATVPCSVLSGDSACILGIKAQLLTLHLFLALPPKRWLAIPRQS
jgi:hypothetical protein